MALFGGVKVLTKDQMYRIHLTALRVLREVGLECHVSDDAFRRLRARGVRVDESARMVWLDEEPVLETIRQLCGAKSAEVTVDGVDKEPLRHVLPARLEIEIGASHGFVLDGRQMRPTRREDLFDCVRLQRHLLGKANKAGLMNVEVPGEVQYIHTTAFNVKYCKNPRATDCNGPEDAAWITRIMHAAGAWDRSLHHRGSIYARSPLCLIGRGAEFLEQAAREGRPRSTIGMPTAGVTAPGTVAGYLLEYLAESFGFATIGRLIADPPNDVVQPPHLMGDDVTVFDMRKGIYVSGGPEKSLMRMAAKQIFGEFYKRPGSHCWGIRTGTDAKAPGIQAAMEKTFQAMCDLMAGMYSDDPEPVASLNCTGSLNTNLMLSFEQAVIDYEWFQWLNRFLRGAAADEEALGFEAIKRVGPSGEFLTDEHTLRHVRSEWWFPSLLHRGAWDAWDSEGRPDVMGRAREVVEASKKIDVPCVLPDETAREVDHLVQEAERDLLGTTTGMVP